MIRNVPTYCHSVARLVFLQSMERPGNKRVELEELSMVAIPEPDVIDVRRECLNHCLLQFPAENRELIIEYYRKEGWQKIAHLLDAVINFSALQSFPLERVDFMKSSDHISVKYFFDFYISYRRGI
jgi:hypothetical protein